MTVRNLKPALTFILVCSIGASLVYMTDNSCDAISQYVWTVQFGVGSILYALLKKGLIFAAGIGLFLLIRKMIKLEKYDRFKIIYFGLLPFFVFHSQFLLIPKNIMHREIEKSICSKSSTKGMTTESNTISLMEYNYLKGKLFLLPKLPGTSDSIDLSYRTDNFLGDFSLNIRFCCSIKEQVDTTDKRWTILSIDKSTGKKRIDYYDNEN